MWPVISGVFSGFFDNFGFCGQIYNGKSTKNLKKVFYIIRVICEKKTTLAWKGYPFYEKRFKETIVYQEKKLKIYQKRPRISDKKFEKCSILYLQLRWKSTFRGLFQLDPNPNYRRNVGLQQCRRESSTKTRRSQNNKKQKQITPWRQRTLNNKIWRDSCTGPSE